MTYLSESGEWETPPALFRFLDERFHFDLDPCATPTNAKCKRFFTREDDGLTRLWNGRVFMNPPYGKPTATWVEKAYLEARNYSELVVALLPSYTDTTWWHTFVMQAPEIWVIQGRLRFRFLGVELDPARFSSCVVVFDFRTQMPFGRDCIDLRAIKKVKGVWQWS